MTQTGNACAASAVCTRFDMRSMPPTLRHFGIVAFPAFGRVLRVIALACSVLPATGLFAADVNVVVHRTDDTVSIEASALVNADADTAWRVLTDYDRYSDFVPGLRSSRVVARRGDRLTVAQSGDAPLWLLRMPFDITYEVTETPPFRVDSIATASESRVLTSHYLLTPSGNGVRIEYAGNLTPRRAWLGRFEQLAVRQGVIREFQALADEIEHASGRCDVRC